jgi:2'-5' RNA ligase
MTRIFIAVEVPEAVCTYLETQMQRFAALAPKAHWTNTVGLHITLAFLGELDDQRLALASEAIQEVASLNRQFTVRITSLGTFGEPQHPRVLWARLMGNTTRLRAVQAQLMAALVARGFPPQERPYSPHLTLGRLSLKQPLSERDALEFQQIIASTRWMFPATRDETRILAPALSLMKSELQRRASPIYTCLQRFPLIEKTPRPRLVFIESVSLLGDSSPVDDNTSVDGTSIDNE